MYNYGDKTRNKDNDEAEEGNGNGNGLEFNVTEILIQLVNDNTLLYFKDQHGIPCLRIKVADYAEIMRVESKKFEYIWANYIMITWVEK